MQVDLIIALAKDQETIQTLGRFYIYEMSRYCGFMPGWEVPSNGLYECIDLSGYWEKSDHYPFLIKVDEEIAGFALINKMGSSSDVDWNMGEFFIVSKFQKKGVGRQVAHQIFNQFPGVWEVSQMPPNTAAIDFWEKVISHYTHNHFEQTHKIIAEPKPHPMVVLKFHSSQKHSQDESYQLYYKQQASSFEEEILMEGIIQEATKNGMTQMQPFAFFVKDKKNTILAGVKGVRLYGSLYIDLLWVSATLRNKGWGSQLIQECEKLGKERACAFVSLSTMDWEALPFYQKLGYQIEYIRKGYEKDSIMYLLRKNL